MTRIDRINSIYWNSNYIIRIIRYYMIFIDLYRFIFNLYGILSRQCVVLQVGTCISGESVQRSVVYKLVKFG